MTPKTSADGSGVCFFFVGVFLGFFVFGVVVFVRRHVGGSVELLRTIYWHA